MSSATAPTASIESDALSEDLSKNGSVSMPPSFWERLDREVESAPLVEGKKRVTRSQIVREALVARWSVATSTPAPAPTE